MCDYGADVLKVETPDGDMWRKQLLKKGSTQAYGPAFLQQNRGKRSIVLDLKQREGLAVLRQILSQVHCLESYTVRPQLFALN